MLAANVKVEKKLWTCPRCGRQFGRRGQAHSCRAYNLENHFEKKPESKLLYEKLKQALKQYVGPFKVESLECCIHFVRTYTFAAVIVLKNKIRVDFSLSRKMRNKRIVKSGPLSANRYVYFVDVSNENEIDEELLQWIKESHDKELDESPHQVVQKERSHHG